DVLAGRAGTPAVELARHLLAAGRPGDALPYCLRAAADAERGGAFVEAAALYERALPGAGGGAERTEVLRRLGRALTASGQVGRAIGHLEEALEHLQRAGEALEAAAVRVD